MKTLEVIEPLSVAEAAEWKANLKAINKSEKHIKTWVAAVQNIREKKLYREEFGTFEDFCKKMLNVSARTVQLAFNLEETRSHLRASQDPEIKQLAEVSSENVLSEVAKIPKSKREKVFKQAAKESGGKPTPTSIKQTAARESHKPLPQKPPPARAILGTNAPIDVSIYTGTRDQKLPPLGTKPPKRTDTPPENERAKDAAQIIKVTDEETAAARIEQIYLSEKPWFNSTSPERAPCDVKDRIVKAMREGMNE